MDSDLDKDNRSGLFEAAVLPHLDAAYNFARWLTRNDQDAEDIVQAAFVRAFRFFDGFRGDDARSWLLTIVRNVYYSSLRDSRHENEAESFDEMLHSERALMPDDGPYHVGSNPEAMLQTAYTRRAVTRALEKLPGSFREVIVLKEIEDLSYKEIADIAGIPIGTVMSRLSRGRKLLIAWLEEHADGGKDELQ